MTEVSAHLETPRRRASRWAVATGWTALAGLSLAVLQCWFWVGTIGLAFGPRFSFWGWLAGLIAGLSAAIGLALWLARRQATCGGATGLLAIVIAWSLAGAAIWGLQASPFARHVAILLGFAATSWWLLWAWLMFLVPWRLGARVAVLAALGLVAGALVGAAGADGLDGDALPLVAWRLGMDGETWQPAERLEMVAPDPAEAEAWPDDPARDYPRFRGADGTGAVDAVRLGRDWLGHSWQPRWRNPVGQAWSSLAVAGGQVFTQEQRGEKECVVCYARHDGRTMWVHEDAAHYDMPSTGGGPRATPTVDGNRVLALGATGTLNCLDRRSGARLWSVDILKDAGASAPIHGMAGSPLVVDELVVVVAGGTDGASLVAYDKASGRRVWAAGNDPVSYASPMLVELAGLRQIVIVTTERVVGHDVQGGQMLWHAPLVNDQRTNCSQPCRVGDDRLFASTNYGTGCELLKITRDNGDWQARTLWASRALQTKFSSAVVRAGHAYGLDDGILECVSLADGRRRWKRGRYGHGQLLLAGDLLVVLAEDGRVALVEARPEEYRELGQFQALEGRTWNYPALAGNELFIRNDREAACYELPLSDDAPPRAHD